MDVYGIVSRSSNTARERYKDHRETTPISGAPLIVPLSRRLRVERMHGASLDRLPPFAPSQLFPHLKLGGWAINHWRPRASS
jgi:hypothetical protein